MIFPALTETIVLALDKNEVERRIGEGIEARKFVGVIDGGAFSLTPALLRPPQFQPVMRGRIESSSRGSMIFLKYELLPATKVMLVFASVLALAGTLGASITNDRPLWTLWGIAATVIFRSVALTNIRLHRDPVRQNLLDILS